jgi:hypothetical protein
MYFPPLEKRVKQSKTKISPVLERNDWNRGSGKVWFTEIKCLKNSLVKRKVILFSQATVTVG